MSTKNWDDNWMETCDRADLIAEIFKGRNELQKYREQVGEICEHLSWCYARLSGLKRGEI